MFHIALPGADLLFGHLVATERAAEGAVAGDRRIVELWRLGARSASVMPIDGLQNLDEQLLRAAETITDHPIIASRCL
jgi:hypothetical protein